ncbi:MAG TPA: DNA cytosine methyltransferase [Patescibacteria group bacterium]|nr:DNA cytosine methyltransferase [Patescibacteria group bacterium]
MSTCVSLFSGCGGLDLGLKKAGFDIVMAEDNDPFCAESHLANFPGVPFHLGSIADLTPDLADHLSGGRAANADLVAGGPPCPPFSKSRFYRTDKPRALDDPIGWETIHGYMKVVESIRPRAFLLENVPGLAYAVHGDALSLILNKARDLGYATEWRVLNAADYGVPQIRERLFIVGLMEGSFKWPEPTHAKAGEDGLLLSRSRWVTAGDTLQDLDTEANSIDIGHFAGGRFHDALVEVPPGDNYLFHTEKRGHPNPQFGWRKRYWSFLLKLSPDMPSWTIQARRSNNMGPFHWRNRILRIDEVKRLQTFPDDWHLAGKVETQWRQVGNAVPVLLAQRLGEQLMHALENEAVAADA